MYKQLNLFYPQWQGGGPDRSTYFGALELKQHYLGGLELAEVEVSLADVTAVKHGIYGYDEILKQMSAACRLIGEKEPDKIFTIGGGCDAGVSPLSYLNHKAGGDLGVIWFDAHGDINSPQTSQSKLFYGMPVRTLLGEGEQEILNLVPKKLRFEQLVMLGLRDLDEAEREYIDRHKITVLSAEEIEAGPEAVLTALKTGSHRYTYIHLDLDVLDPKLFPHLGVPAAGGLTVKTLSQLLEKLERECELIGLGLFGYKTSGIKSISLLEDIIRLSRGPAL